MAKQNDIEFPEVFVSTEELTAKVSRLVKESKARKIGPAIYTTNMNFGVSPDSLVRKHLWPVVAGKFPGAVICYRTAFEGRPTEGGVVFVSGSYDRLLKIPGLAVSQVKGSDPQEGDTPFVGGLFMASRPRAFLENLAPTRTRGPVSRSVGIENVQHRLAEMLRINGEESLNKLRDEARRLAPILGLDDAYKLLDKLIGALLRSRDAEGLTAPTAIAYALGESYDPSRLQTFEALRAALATRIHVERKDDVVGGEPFHNVAFFDAYFSNYIEGTAFEVDEALDIVFRNQIPQNRPDDAHDIIGTWRVVGNETEMLRIPKTFEEFLAVLRRRHALILEGRPLLRPGEFKEKPNRAGATHFVEPKQVRGTLRKGFEFYQSLDHPFARALFMMFVIAEVHPFQDGNGRIARAMMNAELVAGQQRRILIPSVYRTEYVGALKRLTNHRDPEGFIRVMDYAQDFSSRVDFTHLMSSRMILEQCNALKDPSDAVKLLMPADGLPQIRPTQAGRQGAM